MHIVGRDKLAALGRKHANSRPALEAWLEEVQRAAWLTPHEINANFGSADFLSGNRVIFNIKGKPLPISRRSELCTRMGSDRMGGHTCRI